jgi:putative CocE/NonD family hydrolase
VAGWYDIFLSGTVKNFTSLQREAGNDRARANQKLVIGPWFHIPWKPLVGETSDNASPNLVDDLQLAWFDRNLKGASTELSEAPVTLFIMGEDRWRDYDSWPPPGSTRTAWYLHSGGRANSSFGDGSLSPQKPGEEPADLFTYDPGIPNLSIGGHSCCFTFAAPMGPANQAESEQYNQVLVYTSEPLERDLLLIGEAEVVLHAATTAVDTDWTARLCRVDAHGVSINLQEGIVRARYRDSLTEPSLLEPNRIYEYTIKLGPLGVRIGSGDRLRVTISSSDFPQWDRNMNTGGALGTEGPSAAVTATQSVLHTAAYQSRVILPVVEGPA